MCGISGVAGHPNAKELLFYSGLSLQHRGQTGCGIAGLEKGSENNHRVRIYKDFGGVKELFKSKEVRKMEGDTFIFHTRYPTQGENSLRNLQPLYTSTLRGMMTIVDNGDLVNMREQTTFIKGQGIRLDTDVDSELIAATINYQISRKDRSIIEAIRKTMQHVRGSYSAALLTEFDERLFLFRDKFGIRPFFLGKIDNCYAFASETCALHKIKAEIIGEVEPGEIVTIGADGLQRYQGIESQSKRFCVFELIYFSRPDSEYTLNNVIHTCQYFRKNMGKQLAKEWEQKADIVISIPKSGNAFATGYAEEIGIPFDIGIITDPDAGRTFIETRRQEMVSYKFNALKDIVEGKDILVIDDSLFEGENTRKSIEKLRCAGAKKIHLGIGCPPSKYPCKFGIDTGDKRKLLKAAKISIEEIRQYVGADSLRYLSLDGLYKAIGHDRKNFCDGCFTAKYPIPLTEEMKKEFCQNHSITLDYFDRTET